MDLPSSGEDDRLRHIQNVIREQFGSELTYKEGELEKIEDRIRLAKLMLQRLRLGVLAQHYGVAGFYPTALDFSEENVGVQSSWRSFEQEFLKRSPQEKGTEGDELQSVVTEASEVQRDGDTCSSTTEVATATRADSATTASLPPASLARTMMRVNPLQSLGEMSSHLVRDYSARKEFVLGPVPASKKHESASTPAVAPAPMDTITTDKQAINNGVVPTNQSTTSAEPPLPVTMETTMTTPSDIPVTPTPPPVMEISRFYSKRRIIVGNTSQYLHPVASSQENADGSTHKWMVYVRGPHEDPDISNFVKAVRFFLHPSYHPNDIIRVTRPPFHLIRLGWGEFPVRVQLEFCDRRNKPVDIIHNLVLDRTHTGQQTLGAETVVDLDINPRKEGLVMCSGPNGLNHPLMNGHFAANNDIINSNSSPVREEADVTKISIYGNVIGPLSEQPQADLKTPESIPAADNVSAVKRKDSMFSDFPQSMRMSRESSSFSKTSNVSNSVTTSHHPPATTTSSSYPFDKKPADSLAPSSTSLFASVLSGRISQPQVLTTNLEKCLHSAVRTVPLYGHPGGSDDFHLTAFTVEQFKSWSIGRRRAAEWMRALAVKRHVERKLKLGMSSLLSTKQVMQWCRRNGYTLLDPCVPKGVGFCKYCGCQLEVAIGGEDGKTNDSAGKNVNHVRVHERCREVYESEEGLGCGLSRHHDDCSLSSLLDMEEAGEEKETDVLAAETSHQTQGGKPTSLTTNFRPLSTLSGSERMFTDLIVSQKRLEREAGDHNEDEEVDVETLPGCTSARARGYENPIPRLRVPQTPELKWIQQTAASLGISIYPAVLDHMYAHVVEHMIYMSCTRFLKAILMQSLQEAGRRVEGDLPSERVLTPLHVFQAIESLDQCDFLTNKHLGLKAKKLNKEGGVSDDQLSSSCSSSDEEG